MLSSGPNDQCRSDSVSDHHQLIIVGNNGVCGDRSDFIDLKDVNAAETGHYLPTLEVDTLDDVLSDDFLLASVWHIQRSHTSEYLLPEVQ